VLVTFLIYISLFNTFSIFESVVTPIVTDQEQIYTDTLSQDLDFAWVVFGIIGIVALMAFLFFNFVVSFRQGLSKWGDRTYLFFGLIFGLLGSLFLIDYTNREIGLGVVLLGISILTISFYLGRIATNNMFSKMVGSSLTRSYFTYCLILIALVRMIFCYINVYLLE